MIVEKKCMDCPHFRIVCEPIRAHPGYWEFGEAECQKHKLFVEFHNRGKLKKLRCIEEDGKD